MDEGGNIKKRENFEWYFECKKEIVKKEKQITYTYETSPVETQQCSVCNGSGREIVNPGASQVDIRCRKCSGTGMVSVPKSQLPKVVSHVAWNWWNVNVKTIPVGATVKHFSTNTKQYEAVNALTPCSANFVYNPEDLLDFYYHDNNGLRTYYTPFSYNPWRDCKIVKTYPIIVEYNGQSVKVNPCKSDGKELSKIVVDFSSGTPIVVEGQKVE